MQCTPRFGLLRELGINIKSYDQVTFQYAEDYNLFNMAVLLWDWMQL